MNPRFAILLDGGFVTKILTKKNHRFPVASDIVAETTRIANIDALKGHDLFRIYYYDAPPATGTLTNPLNRTTFNLQTTPSYNQHFTLIQQLEMSQNFAVRKGEANVMKWKVGDKALKDMLKNPTKHPKLGPQDLVPNIKQKGVDLRIGLDIALLALRQFVQVIVVVAADSDFIPAFKFARREGVRVFLDHLGSPRVRADLKIHTDLVLPPR